MRCPDCHNQVEANTQVCANCGAIVSSLFTNGFEDFTQSKVAVGQAPQAPQGTDVDVVAIDDDTRPANQRDIGTQIVEMDPESQRGTQIVEVAVPRVVRQAAKSQEVGGVGARDATDGAGHDINGDLDQALRHFYLRLSGIDRLALASLCATFIFSFFPWTEVVGVGWVSGIEGLGAGTAVAAVLSIFLLWLRSAYRRFAALTLVGQLIFAAIATALPIYLSISAHGVTVAYGLALTALAGALSIVLSLLRFLRL
jgi:hypothetical protein